MLHVSINTLLGAEADAVCGAAYRSVSDERVNRRNGYRHRGLDTRVGTIDVAVPKLGPGLLLPRVAAGAPQVRRTGPHLGGCDLLPARRLHPADGQARPVSGHHHAVEVPGVQPQRD